MKLWGLEIIFIVIFYMIFYIVNPLYFSVKDGSLKLLLLEQSFINICQVLQTSLTPTFCFPTIDHVIFPRELSFCLFSSYNLCMHIHVQQDEISKD